jgi:hypothetical protein
MVMSDKSKEIENVSDINVVLSIKVQMSCKIVLDPICSIDSEVC